MERKELESSLFDEVADVVRGIAPATLGPVHHRAHRYGIKVWFEDGASPREHYEAQVIGPQDVKGAKVLALEIGFHAEHAKEADNDAVLDRLLAREKQWRRTLGTDAVAGSFLGRRGGWRRVSETWPDPDLGADDLAFQLAVRLVDYVSALEPLRRVEETASHASRSSA
jgi:hypothetical protein